MATLRIGEHRVNVDDSFLQLGPDEQQAFVEQVAGQLQVGGQSAPAPQAPTPTPQAPTGQGSIADPALQGLSFGFGDEISGALGAGVNSVAGLFGGGSGESFGDAYRGIRDAARENLGAYRAEKPGWALGAEIAGGLATGGAGAARVGALRGGQSLGKLGAVGAGQGAAYGAGTSEADTLGGLAGDTAAGGLLGGATAALGPAALRGTGSLLGGAPARAGEAVGGAAARLYDESVDILRKAGVKLTTGQQTGVTGLQTLESTIGGGLLGGGIDKAYTRQREQFNRQLMKLAGFTDDDAAGGVLSLDALEGAAKRFGSRYDDALKGKKVDLAEDEFLDDLGEITAKHVDLLPFEQKRQVNDIVGDFLNRAADAPVTGKEYQRIRSNLGRLERKQQGSNPIISDLYGDLRGALDDAFERSAGDTVRGINREYAHFKQLDTLYRRNAGAKKGERLPLATLANQAAQKPGSREWKDLTRAGLTVLGDSVPNSGTATRQLATGGGLLGGGLVGGLPGAAAAGATQFGLSQALGRGLGSGAINAAGRGAQAAGQGLNQLGQLPLGVLATPAVVSQAAQPPLPPVRPGLLNY